MARFLFGISAALIAHTGTDLLTGDQKISIAVASIAAVTVWFWAWGGISRTGVEGEASGDGLFPTEDESR